jgi:Rod binding domain-containing protein
MDWRHVVQPVTSLVPPEVNRRESRDSDIAEVARELEASFLAVMLREAGVGTPRGEFGGGSGEDQFASFLVDAYAGKMTETGGIGLAESIFRSLRERTDGSS